MLQRCRQANLKLNKEKYLQVNMHTIFAEVISRHGLSTDPGGYNTNRYANTVISGYSKLPG